MASQGSKTRRGTCGRTGFAFRPRPAERAPDYVEFTDELVARGGHFPLVRSIAAAIGLDAAALALHIANAGRVRSDRAGWVMCTSGWVRAGIGLDGDRLAAALEKLQRLGIAKVERRGEHRLRHVRLDLHRLRHAAGRRPEGRG
jgi:hypothetical protein